MSPQIILKFVTNCRAAGLRISTSEVLDCLIQLELIDILEEEQFRSLLRSNFAKSRREQSGFDRMYDLFFHDMRAQLPTEESERINSRIDEILGMLQSGADGDMTYRAILDFLRGDSRSYLEQLMRLHEAEPQVERNVKFNLSSMLGRLQVMVQLNSVRDAVYRFLGEDRALFSGEARRNLQKYFQRHLENAYSLLLQEPRPFNESIKQVKTSEQRWKVLGELPFSQLTEIEVAQMRDAIAQLVRKLKDIISLRWAARGRGTLDAKKTLRRSARYHGVPLEIIYRKRPPRRGKIVTMCDVSGSVWSAARFMLNMVYSLQECFTKVNSFVFVSGLTEVTEVFENNEINNAIEKVLKEADIEYHVSTDYGETFRHFKRMHMDCLNKKTTLIIMGDARSNYFNPEEKILEEMREKCRRLIWLNPEPEEAWFGGDSEMYTYRPYCHEVRPCRNLNQLADFIEELVL